MHCAAGPVGAVIGHVHGTLGGDPHQHPQLAAHDRASDLRTQDSCSSAEIESSVHLEVALSANQPLDDSRTLFEASLRLAGADDRLKLMRRAFADLLNEDAASAIAQLRRAPVDEQEALAQAEMTKWAGQHPE